MKEKRRKKSAWAKIKKINKQNRQISTPFKGLGRDVPWGEL